MADPSEGADYIKATIATAGLRPFPLIINAIYREPSLADARTQGLRTGVPLPTGPLIDFMRVVLYAMKRGGVHSLRAGSIMPVLVDILTSGDA